MILLRGLLAFLIAAFLAGCDKQPKWNVLLVTFDTTRADRIGSYGNHRIETPTLDSLSARGIHFSNAISAVPITAPSHSTIHTGLYPLAHGVRDNGLFVLGDQSLTLAEILKDEGYQTAAAVGAYPVTAQFGLDQGFDFFDDHLTGIVEDYTGQRAVPKQRMFFDERRAAQVNEAVMPWLADHADDPFFLWVHYFDAHQPFEPPPPYDQLYADDLYNGEIAYADHSLGFLLEYLEQLGVRDRTLVIMTADHGEGLGEHNEITHAVLAYDSTLHVPLIITPPTGSSITQPVIDERVGTVDIVPTVLDLLGVDAPENLHGRTLVPLWNGQDMPQPQYYAENLSPSLTHEWAELRVLYDGPLKYIHGPVSELYDLDADPSELNDLAGSQPDAVGRMESDLAGFLTAYAVKGASTTEAVDPEVIQRLMSLGYLQGGASGGIEVAETLKTGGVSPAERVGDLNDMSSAKHLLFTGDYSQALIYTTKLVKSSDSPMYRELHMSALSALGRLDEAWSVAQQLQSEHALSESMLVNLVAQRFEDPVHRDSAMSLLLASIDDSTSARTLWILASLQNRTGNFEAAARHLDLALERDPDFVPARIDLAVRLARAGEFDEAEFEFMRAIQTNRYHPKANFNYGTLLFERGDLDSARQQFERAIELSPRYLKARHARVVVCLQQGDEQCAQQSVDDLVKIAPRSEEASNASELMMAVSVDLAD